MTDVETNTTKVVKLGDFLDRHGAKIAETIEKNLRPVYNPLQPEGVEEFDSRIFTLLRPPLRVQGEVVKCLAKAAYNENVRHIFVTGEMGTGKTMVGLSVINCADRPLRSLVLCPTHLVQKWIRETKDTIPNARVVDLTVQNVITVLESFRQVKTRPNRQEIYVISKEKVKLSYSWRPAVVYSRGGMTPLCPQCGAVPQKDDYIITHEQLAKKKHFCSQCGSALWQAERKIRRFAPAEYIKKYLKGYFDMVVIDEIQDYKAEGTLQGRAMGSLLSCVKYTLCLTGTLNGGYADDLFHLLFRMDPQSLKRDGFNHDSSASFLATFGTLEKVRKLDEEDSQYGRGKKKKEIIRRRPGVSPVVVGKYLLNKSVFVRLADVIDGLPPYSENVLSYRMSARQQEEYGDFELLLKDAVQKYGMRALAAKLQALLSYPDSCVAFEESVAIKDREGGIAAVIDAPRITLPENELLPKEEDFLRIVQEEKKEGRKVLCYLTFTNSRDIRPRLKEILEREGIRVGILDASIQPKRREAWVRKHAREFDVLISNPELVKTGLDLYDFPTIYFFQTGYNIFTLRQAARRSWRIGQKKPVRIYFAVYKATMQEIAISLIAKKLEVALFVEGDLPEGLAEYGSDVGSIVNEMGKALLEGSNYSGAEKAWANFRKREIEAQLGISGKENIFYDVNDKKPKKQATKEVVEPARTIIKENVLVKVSFIEGKKKSRSVVEVRYDDLDNVAQGKPIQFALF